MRSTIDATRREQRHGSAWSWNVCRDGVPAAAHRQHNPTPSPCCAFSGQSGWEGNLLSFI